MDEAKRLELIEKAKRRVLKDKSGNKIEPDQPALQKPLTLNGLIVHLVMCGFQNYKPLSSVWKMAFIKRKNQSVLCVLIRKNGIDLRYYSNFNDEIRIIDKNKMSMSGGEIYRNHYNESKNLITQKISNIASSFSNGKVHGKLKTEDGRSYMLNLNFATIKYNSEKKWHLKKQEFAKIKSEGIWRTPRR